MHVKEIGAQKIGAQKLRNENIIWRKLVDPDKKSNFSASGYPTAKPNPFLELLWHADPAENF